jgi:hydrogenase maturation protein HypF
MCRHLRRLLARLRRPRNRRYGYPFTNCTHCGPRYTIIQDIPYDRATTTMAPSPCARPARPSTPTRTTAASMRSPMPAPSAGRRWSWSPAAPPLADCSFADRDSLAIIRKAARCCAKATSSPSKGLGGFLLACDAANDAVAELRRRKRRSDKPFALMARDLASVRKSVQSRRDDEAALLDVRRPIVVLPRLPGAQVSAEVAPGNDTLGVMLPYTPLHYLLFSDSPGATPSSPRW